MKSYIAVHKEKGIYLGIFAGFYLFSNSEVAFSTKAIRFNSEEEISEFFGGSKISSSITAVQVQTKDTGPYIDVVDILKSGHKLHTDSMIANIPMENETIH